MMKKIVIVVPSYNNSKWFEKNISSILAQNYENFRVIYTDDCSPDGTGQLVEEYLTHSPRSHKVQFIRNDNRKGALENLYNMIHSCEDDEIIVTVDGDDWFAHANVLKKLDQVYSDPNVWMTYGQYRSFPDNAIGCCQQIPANIIAGNAFRQYQWCSSHLRTFYAGLFKKIAKEDLLDTENKFYAMGWDLPIMFGLLEMSGVHSKFIQDVLYIYNVENPINDSKVNLALQQGVEKIVRAKKKYKPLVSL
jgi:glycosyltransferase involved in cell wall biosynthesis